MLPTPHGPTDAPLPGRTGDTTVDTGRTPDEGALLRVVEHLAEVPDGDPDDAAPARETDAPGDAPPDAADDQAAATDDEVETDDETGVEVETDDEVEADDEAETGVDVEAETAPDQPAAQTPPGAEHDDVVAPDDEVGPVAAALSDTRHRIDELNAAERLFLGQQRALVGELCHDPGDVDGVSALFDRVRAQWLAADDRPDLRPLAEAFGVALGDLVCADAPDLGWATCTDRYGTEIVLAREDPEVLVYPVAAVAQHWHDAAPGWFATHVATVVQGVRRHDAGAEASLPGS